MFYISIHLTIFTLFCYSGDEQQLVDTVNASENTVFVVNAINLVSNLSDVLITAVGGLLPLLSAATTSAVSALRLNNLHEHKQH